MVSSVGTDRQHQVASALARFTGARIEHDGQDVCLRPNVGGVRLPLRVSPGGFIALGRGSISEQQITQLIVSLRSIAPRLAARRAVR